MSKYTKSLLLIFLSILLFSACGNEWESVSKKGNTWQYQIKKGNIKINVTSKVKEKYQIGDKSYAEVILDEKNSPDLTIIYSWDKKQKALTFAGQNSKVKDNKKLFFIKETILAKLKNKKGASLTSDEGTKITYIGEEKVKVPAGKFNTYKFTRINVDKNINQTLWYVLKKGFVKIKDKNNVLDLIKFTEGKGGDPVKPGSKEGFNLIKSFYTIAKKETIKKIIPLFSKSGQTYIKTSNSELKMLIDKIKTKSKLHKTAIYFITSDSVGLRFRYYDDSNNEPNVYRTDALFKIEKEKGKYKIKKFTVSYTKLMK